MLVDSNPGNWTPILIFGVSCFDFCATAFTMHGTGWPFLWYMHSVPLLAVCLVCRADNTAEQTKSRGLLLENLSKPLLPVRQKLTTLSGQRSCQLSLAGNCSAGCHITGPMSRLFRWLSHSSIPCPWCLWQATECLAWRLDQWIAFLHCDYTCGA